MPFYNIHVKGAKNKSISQINKDGMFQELKCLLNVFKYVISRKERVAK